MSKQYKNHLLINIPTSADHYYNKIKLLEKKLKIDDIFSLNETEFDEYFTKQFISGLDKDSKSHLNKYKRFKKFSVKKIKYIKNNKTEFEAISYTTEYFEKDGFIVSSYENANLGYDLMAKKGEEVLTIEVKGLNKNGSSIILTNNEINYLENHPQNHQICVVSNCGSKNKSLEIFIFDMITLKWKTKKNKCLKFDKHLTSNYKIEATT